MSAGDAVLIATKVGDIGFPEFTAKLVTDTFDALISANMRQTESYSQLLATVSKSLSAFINDTKDDITGSMILDYLVQILPTQNGTKVAKAGTLTAADATTLNDALLIKDATGTAIQTTTFAAGAIADADYQLILSAVAKRLSANKYDALQQMVKMGMLRLVVEKGLIETRLTFNTWSYDYDAATVSEYATTTARSSISAGILQTILIGPISSSTTKLSISTASQSQYDASGSAVQIFGLVQLSFKTDYMPLNQ